MTNEQPQPDLDSDPDPIEPQAAPGWYASPEGQRYWDGSQWTEHIAPASAAPGQAQGPNSPALFDGVPSSDDKTVAVLAHLSQIFTSFLGPLLIYLIKEDNSPLAKAAAKEALNFQITLFITFLVAVISVLVAVGLLLLPILAIWGFVMPIVAAIKTSDGKEYRYPLTIRFLK